MLLWCMYMRKGNGKAPKHSGVMKKIMKQKAGSMAMCIIDG